MRRARPWCLRVWAWLLLAATLAAAPARAAEDTLVRLAQTGRIVLGVGDSVYPLSYLAPSGEHVGYHVDVCLNVVKAIQRKFDLPALKVVTVPTTLATRIALLNNQTIDIECALNPVRAAVLSQALLAHATMFIEVRLMTTTATRDMDLQALGGRAVGLLAGAPGAPVVRMMARKGNFKVSEVFGRTPGDVFGLLEAGRADGVFLATPYLMSHRMLSAAPERLLLVDEVLFAEPTAIMFRLGDETLHAAANEAIDAMMKNGELARLYDKWFVQPIPGLPRPLGLPMPAALRALFDAPGSEMRGL